jgi:hypothetical protein
VEKHGFLLIGEPVASKKNGALDCFFFVDFVTALMVYFASTVV